MDTGRRDADRAGATVVTTGTSAKPSWAVATRAVPPVIVAVAAAAAVFHRLDVSAWFDEAFSYGMSTQPIGSFLTIWAWGSESNMFLYYLVLRGWLGFLALIAVPPNEVLLRLPSAAFAVGAAVVVYSLGRNLFGRIAGGAAGGPFLAKALQMILAQTARA